MRPGAVLCGDLSPVVMRPAAALERKVKRKRSRNITMREYVYEFDEHRELFDLMEMVQTPDGYAGATR